MEKLPFSFDPGKSCRVCLSDATYHVFDARPKDEKLPEDVNTYFKIVMTADDNYSKRLCEKCMKHIEKYRCKAKQVAEQQLLQQFIIKRAKQIRELAVKNGVKPRSVPEPSVKEDITFKNGFKLPIVSKPLAKQDCLVELKNKLISPIISKPLIKKECHVKLNNKLTSNVHSIHLVKKELFVEELHSNKLKSIVDYKSEMKKKLDMELNNDIENNDIKPNISSTPLTNLVPSKEIECIKCKYCNLILENDKDFVKHLGVEHCIYMTLRDNGLQLCPLCEDNCISAQFLKHLQMCSNSMKSQNQFICNICSVIFIDSTDCQFRKHYMFCKSFNKFNYCGKFQYKCLNCTFESHDIDICMSHASSNCLFLKFNLKYMREANETRYLNNLLSCTKPFIDFDFYSKKYSFFDRIDYYKINKDSGFISMWHCEWCQVNFKTNNEFKAHYDTRNPCTIKAMVSIIGQSRSPQNIPIKEEFIFTEPKIEPIS